MKIGPAVIDGLVKGPYLYFEFVNMPSIFLASHFVDKGYPKVEIRGYLTRVI